ncbi:MAG: hypothetical protein ACI9BF_000840, partial [Candidatus Paceibacteria bacterium]
TNSLTFISAAGHGSTVFSLGKGRRTCLRRSSLYGSKAVCFLIAH